jgi:methionine-rich copper-binding protein CopC
MRTHVSIVSLLLVALGSVAVHAHAFLDHASPLVGSTVSTAPREVALWFTQKLEPAFSSVQVTDANGTRVDQGKAQVSGSTMRIGLKSLSPGIYRFTGARFPSIRTRRREAFPSTSVVVNGRHGHGVVPW